MTMYYSRAELDYVEGQRMRRLMEAAAKGSLELKQSEDGVYRWHRDGEPWEPSTTISTSANESAK